MKIEDATELLTRVVAQYRGTLEEHQLLQQALEVILEAVNKEGANAKKPPNPFKGNQH